MKHELATHAVHGGESRPKAKGSLTTPIYQTSTYTFENTAAVLDFMEQKTRRRLAREQGADLPLRDEYGRYSNPTQAAVEAKLAILEGGARALLFSSGMAAITTAVLGLLRSGDHMLFAGESYRRTREFASAYLERWGIAVTQIPSGDPHSIEDAILPNSRLLFLECPTNPHLRVPDLASVAEIAQRHSLISVVDSTFATPVNLQPLSLGIDLVAHSASKYLGGHNDLLAGALVGDHALLNPIEELRGVLGCIGGAQDAYLVLRGMKTLALRVERQNDNALQIARYLAGHPRIQRVYYPGLPDHPDHAVAQRLMRGFGGVVSFEVAGDKEATSRFVDALQIPYIGPTLGGVESIVQQQALFVSVDPEERRAAGVSDSLVRYAVGIEQAADLIADLEQALARV